MCITMLDYGGGGKGGGAETLVPTTGLTITNILVLMTQHKGTIKCENIVILTSTITNILMSHLSNIDVYIYKHIL